MVGILVLLSDARLVRPPAAGRTGGVLEIRPNCECCDRDLAADSTDAFICTFECTWCRDCAEQVLHRTCPNCGGELVRRPVRPAAELAAHPPSPVRVVSGTCRERAG